MKTKPIAGKLFKWLGRKGALKRNVPLAIMLIAVFAAIMANFAFSADTIYDKVSAGNYIDVGLDTSKGISMNLVEKGLTHKVLEFEIASEISAQDIQLLIAENNFDAKEGALTRLSIAIKEEPVYEILCNPYNIEDSVNHSINTVQNCTTIQAGTRNVNVEQWLPVELKSSEENADLSLATFNILEKGRYRYSFNTPFIQTASGWGNKGTLFLKVGSDLFADKQHSSWWNDSCLNRISTNVQPIVTDTNMQLYINLSKEIDWKKAFVIDNRTNTSLTWLNESLTWFWTNTSVTANSAFGIDIYYNCNSDTPQYNYSNVMLLANEFETDADVDRVSNVDVLNTTIGQRGNSVTLNQADGTSYVDHGWSLTKWSNTSTVAYFHTLKDGTYNNCFLRLSTGTNLRVGVGFAGTSSPYYQFKFDATEHNSQFPIEQGIWKKFKVHINSTTNLYINDEWVNGSVATPPTNMSSIGWYYDTKKGDSFDTFYTYRDYGINNPGYSVGVDELSPNDTSESAARGQIVESVLSQLPSASIYTDQQVYVRYLNGSQILGTFDKLAVYGNQRWAFNYISSGESFTGITNLTPSLYVWENTLLGTAQVQQQVEALIDSTKA
ncbi:MAG: hypothetical protein WC852_01430 [Candidatus Nanoarchaeia archaeon]|jgi:hypothetical protein